MRPITIVLNGKRAFNLIHVRDRKRNAPSKPIKTRRYSATGGGFITDRPGHRHVYVVLDDLWCEAEDNRETEFGCFVDSLCEVIDHEVAHYFEPPGTPHIVAFVFGDVGSVIRGYLGEGCLRRCLYE